GEGGGGLGGDVMVAAVAGEIEKTQWDGFRGRLYRGYAAGTRYLVSHGGVADMCLLGEPTEGKVVLAHFGTLWARISTSGPFVHTAFSAGRLGENSIVRMGDVLDAVLEWAPKWERRASYRGGAGLVNVGALAGGFPWGGGRAPPRTGPFLPPRGAPPVPRAAAPPAGGRLGRRGRAGV